jgi:hypothetical protein
MLFGASLLFKKLFRELTHEDGRSYEIGLI